MDSLVLMEAKTFLRHPILVLVRVAREYARDLGKTLQALGMWGPVFLGLAIAEGVLPVLMLYSLGEWLEAAQGVRAVGAMTSDWSGATGRVLGCLAASAVVTGVSRGLLGGRAREVFWVLALLSALLMVFVLAPPLQFLMLSALTLMALVVLSVTQVKVRSLLVLLLATLFMSQIFWQLSKFVIARAYTVGESLGMLLLSGGVLMMSIFLTLPTYESRR